MCAALICFSGLDTTAKWLNRTYDPLLTVWWRYAASMVLVSIFINPVSRPGVLRTRRPWVQLLRSLLLFISTAANLTALQYLQLAQTTSIIFATPLLVALFAGPILGERIGPRRLAAVGVGLIGVLIVTRPGIGAMHPAMLLSVLSMSPTPSTASRRACSPATILPATTMVFSGLAGVALMTPALPWIWSTPHDPATWLMFCGVGAFGAFGHWLLILAHARAPAAILSPFIYTQIVWMLALGYIVFGDWPDRWTFVGSGIVIASGALPPLP